MCKGSGLLWSIVYFIGSCWIAKILVLKEPSTAANFEPIWAFEKVYSVIFKFRLRI